MTLDALIFVALAAAWIAYLLPKALQHHETVQRGRSVERFSHRMRVLARREPTSVREARLVVTPGRAPSRPVIETKGHAPVVSTVAARRAAANAAARRRRNVLSVILLGLVVVTALAVASAVSGWYVAIPGTLLGAWLVACRLMVRQERGITARPQVRRQQSVLEDANDADTEFNLPPVKDAPAVSVSDPETQILDVDDPSRWDMVPVTLPTYVNKSPAERRTVQTIDLDSTGVWSSGRNEIDSALARTAQEIKKSEAAEAAAAEDAAQRRAVGH
ncbi:hypothetical protein [Nocardioides gilvus]|uniref:divisome protein SepX/GlpR n=1 Tax=Nocardioides gilvus TaxID=1735589 RepID=UPI000D74AFEE|nr:hypothetical protein [Nocardioides gilvus]